MIPAAFPQIRNSKLTLLLGGLTCLAGFFYLLSLSSSPLPGATLVLTDLDKPTAPAYKSRTSDSWQGTWRGAMRVKDAKFSPSYFKQSPFDATVDEEIFRAGKMGTSTIQISTTGNTISRIEPHVEFVFQPSDTNRIWGLSHTTMYIFLPLKDTAVGYSMTNSRKSSFSSRVVERSVEKRSEKSIRQKLCVAVRAVNHETGVERTFSSKHDIVLEKQSSNRIHVTVLEHEYGPDGTLWKTVVVEGDLERTTF